MATSWTNIATEEAPVEKDGGNSATIDVSGSSIRKIEYIEVYLTATANTHIGDMDVKLTNAGGTESVLAEQHVCRGNTDQPACETVEFSDFRFGSVRHLGEDSNQIWTLTVNGGTLTSWKIKFYGRGQ
jgi:subtilisin-like proprotein convertase family protein